MAIQRRRSPAQLRRREYYSRVARKVGSVVGGPVEQRIERYLLQQAWVDARPASLRTYLVGSYQNPVINIQSILARHELIRELTGERHADLMREELRWAVETNRALRARQHALPEEHGVDFKEVKRRGLWKKAYDATLTDPDRWVRPWRQALEEDPGRRVSMIEAACGSANDYRFIDSYGLARWLDYTGFDLTQANVDNARSMFPNVDFRVGDAQRIDARDQSYDWAVAHDLLEHLSPSAIDHAVEEMCRVSRTGVLISFFLMREMPEDEITPRRTYHVNVLSRERMEARFARHCSDVRWVHVRSWLAEQHDFDDYYNWRAWTMIARH